MSGADPSTLDRRTLLAAAAGGGVASLAGCSLLESGDDAPTGTVDDEQARSLAERFAPTVYFDRREEWFPTDPRRYESERDDGTVVVDGFDALEGYVTDGGGDDPPEPRVFYNVRRYDDSPLAVVQFWLYSAFDQFTTNFHWHDWELLQVFVDVDSGDPQLYVASSHSRRVPNNEHLDPDPDGRPRVLSELGSHSSGLSVNDDEKQFQRLPPEGDVADITNRVVDGLEDVAGIPLAYGLPRDEGGTLPYVVPELDGVPVYEDDRLPSVSAADLVPEEVTVRSFAALSSPPELPERETGLRYEFEGRDADAEADELYDLVPTAELEHIEAFTGPQLSFEFSVPQAAEDAVAGHITTTGTPWKDTRYEAPASDITEATHRQALSERYEAVGEPSPVGQVVAGVTRAVTNDDAPAGAGLETVTASVESVALLQSDPEAVPTFRGVAAVQGVEAGEHTLTVNGAGVAPHGETVPVSGTGTTVAGVDGEIPLVAREMATKVEVEPADGDGRPTAVAVEDDFAGRLYESPVDGPDAVYVHRGGAFTAEVRDDDDDVGAFRVNPADENRVRVENARAGVAPLARYLADVASETRAEVAAVADDDDDDDDDDDRGDGSDGSGQENAVQGLARALAAVAEAAERAAERAEAGDRGGAEQRLEAVQTRLNRVASRLSAARESLPPGLARATDNRLDQATRRAEQARNAGKL